MASVGAAVGLGNIWGFPYRLGEGGGFVFLALYIFFVVAAGIPLTFAELKMGRLAASAPPGAYRAFGLPGITGWSGVAACFIVLCYYDYFGGLLMMEIASRLGLNIASQVFWHLAFAFLTLVVVLAGVTKGIEACSRVMVPALVLILLLLAAVTLSLPGASSALSFLFAPDISRFSLRTVVSALGQALFSLSLGQGIMITYGSYLSQKEPLMRHALLIPVLDTVTALLAAVAIMPAVFSLGFSPSTGPGLLFDVMPRAFVSLPCGRLLALLFFIPVLFAALTSAVSMLETPVASVCEEFHLKRELAAMLVAAAGALCGLPLCFNMKLFYIYENISQNVLMLLVSLATCAASVWVSKRKSNTIAAVGAGEAFCVFLLRYITPVILLFTLILSFLGMN